MASKTFGAAISVNGTTVGGVNNIQIGDVDVNYIDVTTHQSVGGWKNYLGGLKDGGTVTVMGNFSASDTGQLLLMENIGQSTTAATPVVVTLSTGSIVGFDAIIGGFSVGDQPVDDRIQFTATLKVDGYIGMGVRAALTTSMTGVNNDITLTSRRYGDIGDDITITLVDPGATASLAISVSGTAISVTLAYSGAITTTATQLVAALAANALAADLVTAAVKTGDTGAGIVTALTSTPLTGGGL